MGLPCWAYKIYFSFKQTSLASKLFFGGDKFQVFGPKTITGTVLSHESNGVDGDVNFNVQGDDGIEWHCEVTPCASNELRKLAISLAVGSRVGVSGTEAFDPPHLGESGGGHEIHPVSTIVVL